MFPLFSAAPRPHRHRAARIAAATLCLLLLVPALCLGGHGHAKPDKTGILIAFFGTSVPEARHDLDGFIEQVKKAHPGVDVRQAWTSVIIRDKLRATTGEDIPGVARALARMAEDGFTHVAVQSLHTIPGHEFHDLRMVVNAFRQMPGQFRALSLGQPLLSSEQDFRDAAAGLLSQDYAALDRDTALVLMGHGTDHPAGALYPAMQYHLTQAAPRVFLGTVEGTPSYDDVLAALKASGAKKVRLAPFMSVAGDHARNDMAGPEDDSWASMLAAQGFEVESVLQGTAGNPALTAIWLKHLDRALDQLAGGH